MNWLDWTQIVGLALAIIALVTGLFHSKDIKLASDRVRAVQESLSTRFLGVFPSFLKEIVRLVDSAKSELLIQCDFPGYATLSDPVNALAYRYAIERQRERGVKIRLVCLDETARKRYLGEQYTKAEWQRWTEDGSKRELLRRFIRAYGNSEDAGDLELEQFFAACEAADRQLLKQVFEGHAHQTGLAMSIYFWIADGSAAIFSIPTLSEITEYGFKTSDPKLIQALTELGARYGLPD